MILEVAVHGQVTQCYWASGHTAHHGGPCSTESIHSIAWKWKRQETSIPQFLQRRTPDDKRPLIRLHLLKVPPTAHSTKLGAKPFTQEPLGYVSDPNHSSDQQHDLNYVILDSSEKQCVTTTDVLRAKAHPQHLLTAWLEVNHFNPAPPHFYQ